jgi:O-succinylbenzoic acid--CoA ligase
MTTDALELLPDVARRHAIERPSDPAILDGDRAWTWAELDRRADGIAAALIASADGAGDRVALAIGTTAAGVAAIHGVARAGLTAVLVNPRLTSREIAGLLDASGATVLAIDGSVGDAIAPAGVEIVDIAAIEVTDVHSVRNDAASEFLVPTSGTTAHPKLARLPLDRLAASAIAWNAALPPATGWLLSLGSTHVAGLGIVVRAATAGVPVVIPRRIDPVGLLGAVDGARARGVEVSHVSLVAAQLAALLDATGDAPPPDGLRAAILGGGPIPESLRRRASAAGWPVVESYGMTETASGVAIDGRPLPGVELRLADDGEILVRGPMVFAGYLDDAAATSAAIDADGWLRTGDLGRLDDAGRMAVAGRRDDLIIRGGENVSPAEVERALASHPGVADVAVAGIPDAALGEVVAAVIVPAAGADPTDDELRAHVRERLAGFKVPSRITRVRELPRTALGKVARPEVGRLTLTAERRRSVTVDDGQAIAVRELGPDGARVVVLLHATLSSSDQLLGLGRRLADRSHVVLIDRRGSGGSSMTEPAPVDVARHVADVIAVVDALGIGATTLVGHSFGGVVALETAVLHPARVTSVVAWEPPFMPLAPRRVREGMARIGDDVAAAYAAGGAEAAARLFLETVSGAGAWDRLHPRQRDAIGRAGTGALADVAMGGLTPGGLERIACPTLILTGEVSERFYRPIADAVAKRIGAAATRVHLPDLRHMAPITDPAAVADAVLTHLDGPDDQETRT